MKVWLYYRLSRDEDDELNSLTNQRKIIYEYAVTNGHEVVGESFDDNVSGMHFNREGIGWVDTERRLPCSSTTCGSTMFASSRRRKISIRSTKMTISSLASKVWSTISMRATAAAVCGPATGKNKRKGS